MLREFFKDPNYNQETKAGLVLQLGSVVTCFAVKLDGLLIINGHRLLDIPDAVLPGSAVGFGAGAFLWFHGQRRSTTLQHQPIPELDQQATESRDPVYPSWITGVRQGADYQEPA